MTACPSLAGDGVVGVATALRMVDCQAGAAAAVAFSRIFGVNGALLPALTIFLTIAVALFAIGLLTGRLTLDLRSITPRVMTLGLALTFATSWAAYGQVVWGLATGAPDEVARVVAGTRGPAVDAFGRSLDRLIANVADAAQAASKPAAEQAAQTAQAVAGPAAVAAAGIAPAQATVGGFSASTVLWFSVLMLLLGTVGVIVTAKVVLAALLAVGPLFVMLAVLPATRGLFEGWLKGVALFALVPLFAVLIGGATLAALSPVANTLAMSGAQPDPQPVTIMFLGAAVHVALMVMALKLASTMVMGWRLPGAGRPVRDEVPATAWPPAAGVVAAGASTLLVGEASAATPAGLGSRERVSGIVAALPPPPANDGVSPGRARTEIVAGGGEIGMPARAASNGLGHRFRPAPSVMPKGYVS